MTYIIIYYYESCAYLYIYYFSDVSTQIFTLLAYYTNNYVCRYATVKYYYLMIKNVIVSRVMFIFIIYYHKKNYNQKVCKTGF